MDKPNPGNSRGISFVLQPQGSFKVIDHSTAPSDEMTDSRSKYVYNHLIERIRSGDIQSGERLTEVEIAKQLGVSRTPVREALKNLHTQGLLEVVPGRGMELAELDNKQVIDLYEMRATLEGMAAALASQHATKAQIDDLYALVRKHRENLEDVQRISELNQQFHRAIYDACENPYLRNALSTLEDTLGLVRNKS